MIAKIHLDIHPIWIENCEECRIKVCRTGCKTQDHNSYGDCLQASNIAIDKTSLKVRM